MARFAVRMPRFSGNCREISLLRCTSGYTPLDFKCHQLLTLGVPYNLEHQSLDLRMRQAV